MSNIKDFRENIVKEILSLGVDFKENPAMSTVIAEIEGIIADMNLGDDESRIQVNKSNQTINFIVNKGTVTYSVAISSPSNDALKCHVVQQKQPKSGPNGGMIVERSEIEMTSEVKDTGVTITTNSASSRYESTEQQLTTYFQSAEKKHYDKDGIMDTREFRGLPSTKIPVRPVDYQTYQKGMLMNSRKAFQPNQLMNYEQLEIWQRDKLDTAKVYIENKNKKEVFKGVTPLNRQHGLRNMEPMPVAMQKEVSIPPVPIADVEKMLQAEKNPKIREGLKKYAKGRDTYHYLSSEDPNFIYEDGTTMNRSR